MDIKKRGLKLLAVLTILFVIASSMYILISNRNTKNSISKASIEEIVELMNINSNIIIMDKNTEKSSQNHIDNIDQNLIKLKDTEVAISELNEVNIVKEENTDIFHKEKNTEVITEVINENSNKDINTNEVQFKATQDKKQTSISNRGGFTDKGEKLDISSKNLNEYVLDVVSTYSLEEGAYPYLLNNDFENYNGVTEDIYYKGELILRANPNGNKASHCTGISFEVFFKAMQKRNKELGIPIDDFNGMTGEELFDMALTWFVAKGPKSESNLAVALENYGLGTRINDLENVRPGDFIDFSRENNSGHAVVFMNWIREGDKIIGLRFWSSQGSTNGISYKEEYFNIKDKSGNKYGGVIKDSLYIVRVRPVSEYK